MIGIASPSFCFTGFTDVLERIDDHFELWEILLEVEHTIDKIDPVLSDHRHSYGLRLQAHAPMSDVNIGSVYERMRLAAVDDISRAIDFCRKHDMEVLTVHPGFFQGIAFLDRQSVTTQMKRSLKEIDAIAEDGAVAIALENMPKGINATCTTAKELTEAVLGTGLGLCFDMGHANTAGQIDAFLNHVDRFRNVHLHNNDGSWDQHNIIDQGSADLKRVVSSILDRGYKGNLIIESEDLDTGVKSKGILQGLLE